MVKNHRVYPVDSPPCMNSGQQQRYQMLGEDGNGPNGLKPPPYRRNVPQYHSSEPKKKKCGKKCCKCICCIYCFLFLLVIILVGLSIALYYLYNPKIPTYKVQNMDVTAFEVKPDFSVHTKFVVNVKADNPNERIEIGYDKGSSVKVTYQGATLSTGKLPSFVQPHKNITIIPIALDGQASVGSGLQEALMDNKSSGKIPLDITIKAPVQIRFAGDTIKKSILVKADISLVLDSLSPKKKPSILSSNYKVWVKLPKYPESEHRVV